MAAGERLISADSHVHVTQDAVTDRLPAKVRAEYEEAAAAHQAAENAEKAGHELSLASWDLPGARSPGYREPNARLKDMDHDGVDAEVIYSELSGFRHFHRMRDGWKEAARAFNDVLADFAAVDPKRLVVAYQLPIVDVAHAVSEVERLAGIGARTVQLPIYPAELGFADYHDARYDPLWSVLSETGVTVSQHLGPKASLWDVFRRDPTPQKGIYTSLPALGLSECIGFWILPGVLERFPGLKIVLVEPGLGWVPWYLDTLDSMAETYYDFPALKEKPSTYFHRQMYLTFVDDPHGLELRHQLGVENIMWSTDFPHPATTWPHSREVVDRQFVHVPADERELMVCGNAARLYNL